MTVSARAGATRVDSSSAANAITPPIFLMARVYAGENRSGSQRHNQGVSKNHLIEFDVP